MTSSTRLKFLADVRVSSVDKKSADGEVPVRLCNYTDVYYRDRITADVPFMEATAPRTQVEKFRLQVGQTLVTKDSETADDIGVPAYVSFEAPDLVCGYHLAQITPTAALDPRFLFWFLSADRTRSAQSLGASGVTRFGLRTETLNNLRVHLPMLQKQRRVASFLDAETQRIDQLIAVKTRMIDVVRELEAGRAQNALNAYGVRFPLDGSRERIDVPEGWHVTTLVRCLRQLTNGYVGPTRDVLVDEGVRYIQGVHIKGGRIDFDRRPFYVPEEWHNARPRIHPRAGDVLLVQTGDIGQVAVVPGDFGPASCHALQILRVEPGIVSGEFLGLYLRTPFGQDSLLARATGALHPHLEGGIRDVPVVVPPQMIQDALVADARYASAIATETEHALTGQIDLLHEHRRALINAAVTGEMEVT